MNKYQEALNDVINNNLGNWKYKNDSFYFLQELVDKQTPMKIVKLTDEKIVGDITEKYTYNLFVCPKCSEKNKVYILQNDRGRIPFEYLMKNNYCPNCGQKLEWEE